MSSARTQVFVVPFEGEQGPKRESWIEITSPGASADKAVWSPDGDTLYFTSDQDGFTCVWARRVDRVKKRPAGPLIEVYHSHSARRSLANVSILEQEIGVGPDLLAFHMGEQTGNIWMKQE